MPTPVGPAAPDPNDPDLWDWDENVDDFRPSRHPWRASVAVLVVLLLVLLLLASVL
jgi:hypothetical protein